MRPVILVVVTAGDKEIRIIGILLFVCSRAAADAVRQRLWMLWHSSFVKPAVYCIDAVPSLVAIGNDVKFDAPY
jgi:hypothetical protein